MHENAENAFRRSANVLRRARRENALRSMQTLELCVRIFKYTLMYIMRRERARDTLDTLETGKSQLSAKSLHEYQKAPEIHDSGTILQGFPRPAFCCCFDTRRRLYDLLSQINACILFTNGAGNCIHFADALVLRKLDFSFPLAPHFDLANICVSLRVMSKKRVLHTS
jgi:hypothetical protein